MTRPRPRTRAMAALVAVGALILTGCSSAEDSGGGSGGSGADNARETYTVGIDVAFHPIFDYVMGQAEEYFGDKDYDVEFQVLDATTQVPAFGAGDLDVMTTVPSFMPRVKEQFDIDTTYFFPMARWTPGPTILVPPDSAATSIEDLEGATVAVAPLSSRFGAEQMAVLAATGQNIEDYFDLVETDAAAQEIAGGRAEAVFIEAPSTAPLLAEGYTEVFSVQDAFEEAFDDPAVMNGGYIAASSFVSDNSEFVQDLIAATQDAWDTFQSDPDTVIEVASEVSGVPPEQLELVGQVLNLAETTDEQKKVTEQDVATWTELFPLLAEAGFITEAPEDPAALFQITE